VNNNKKIINNLNKFNLYKITLCFSFPSSSLGTPMGARNL